MSLASKLDRTKAVLREALSPEVLAGIESSVADLRASGLAGRAVGVGDVIALPVLTTLEGRPFDLGEAAAGQPVVLIFYRGGWCPYCSTTLRAYGEIVPRIEAAGGMVIAVTPERPCRAAATVRSNDVRFTVAVDEGNRFGKSLGLVTALPTTLRPLYREIGIDLSAENGDDSHELAIPATYVLAPCGRIAFAHVDPDFTQRADPNDVVAALERLAATPADRRETAADRASAWENIR